MSSTETYTPREPRVPRRVTETVTIPAPPEYEDKPKMKMFQLALVVGMPAVMLGMMILMFQSGMRSNPMMMIMPVMMIVSMVSGTLLPMLTGGDDGRDIDSDRQNYMADLANKRKAVHTVARSQHAVQKALYPSPRSLPTLIRHRDASMWTALPPQLVGGTDNDSLLAAEGTEQSGSNFFKPRIGVGNMLLDPPIETDQPASVSPEHLEPVAYAAHRNFETSQNIVVNSPLPVKIDYPVIGLRGHDAYRNDLVRAIVTSLAYTNSPEYVMVAVVAEPDNNEWDWIKWLPHNANVFEDPITSGFPTMRWSSFAECARYLMSKHPLLVQHNTRMLVVVDDPTVNISFPRGITAASMPNVTFLIVRSFKDDAVTTPEHNFHISNDRGFERSFSAFDARDIAIVDKVPRELAETIAREMSCLRPPRFGKRELVDSSQLTMEPTVTDAPTVMDALGVDDLENYNLPARWKKTDMEKSFKAPLGFKVNANNQPTGDFVYLDVLQLASGGTGPHGLFSGGTGTGKSFLLRMLVLFLAVLYSPNRLVFIFMDFKGGATFNELSKLPHALANMTNLEGAQDVVARAKDVIQGENKRRQQIFQNVGVEDIQEYRKAQKNDPSLENLPDLMIIVDEGREFLMNHAEYREVFQQIAAVGRSTGMHLLIGSQYIDEGMIGDTANYTFGFSLKVKQAAHSNVVVRNHSASQLPPSKVGILWHTKLQDEFHDRFQGFDHEQPYVIKANTDKTVIDHDTVEAPKNVGDATAVAAFTQTGFSGIEQKEDVASKQFDSVVEETGGDVVTDKTQFKALLDLVLEESEDYTKVREMWATPLSTPMTFASLASSQDEMRPPEDGRLSIRVGDIDQPFYHRRLPLEVGFTPQTGNLAIVGGPGTGKSTTLKTLIASSGVRYSGRDVAFFIYDYASTALSDMENYPNVAIYTGRGDEDGWRRIRGEVRRLITLRSAAMREHRITSVDEYFAHRDDLGIEGDFYRHIVVAFDGIDRFYEDVKDEGLDAISELASLLADAPSVGIFFAGTFNKYLDSTRLDKFGQGIRHHIATPADTFKGLGNQAFRDKLTEMPSQEPGRVIDMSTTDTMGQSIALHGRIMLPIGRAVKPERVTNNVPVYALRADYSSAIREFGASLAAAPVGKHPAPELKTPGTRMDLSTIVAAVDVKTYRNKPAHKRVIPYGVDAGTYMPAVMDLSKNQNHIIVTGNSGSGKTTTLRTFMHAIGEMYTSDEARFIVLDATQDLIDDTAEWVDKGYMKNDSYFMTSPSSADAMKRLQTLMSRRLPDEEEVKKNPRMMSNRTYFTGPEIFVIVNGAEQFMNRVGVYGADKTPLEKAIDSLGIYDLGVHFILTMEGGTVVNYVSGQKTFQTFVETQNPEFLLHSGPAGAGAIILGTKARFRELPPGRVQSFSRVNDSSEPPQIQVGYVEPPKPVEPEL